KALIPNERFTYTKNEAKKSVVSICYMMANMRNKFVNSFKLEVELYFSAYGLLYLAIDVLHSLGVFVCSKTIDDYKKKIMKNHPQNIHQFFMDN
ncbi:2571_t:CDS:1, partial [Scutellospora calospora]